MWVASFQQSGQAIILFACQFPFSLSILPRILDVAVFPTSATALGLPKLASTISSLSIIIAYSRSF